MRDFESATKLFLEVLKQNPERVIHALNTILFQDGSDIELRLLRAPNKMREEASREIIQTFGSEKDSGNS